VHSICKVCVSLSKKRLFQRKKEAKLKRKSNRFHQSKFKILKARTVLSAATSDDVSKAIEMVVDTINHAHLNVWEKRLCRKKREEEKSDEAFPMGA
jgi:hypothetical protein